MDISTDKPKTGKEDGTLELAELQERIDQIRWYHDIDFPNGLKARSKTDDAEGHRKLWSWMRSELDKIDFAGKKVLDIGCWDGHWSFYAERRGASRVLATDDETQNWAGSAGLNLAKELMGSSIETRTDLSIYEAAKLEERFDIVLCMGVYYHLVDPFLGFSQVRHCAHEQSIVVFEGDFAPDWFVRPQQAAYLDVTDGYHCFMPTVTCLRQMLEANYFHVLTESTYYERILVACQPFVGENTLHRYRPPSGLHLYDPRFSGRSSLQQASQLLEASDSHVSRGSIYEEQPTQPANRISPTRDLLADENASQRDRHSGGTYLRDPRVSDGASLQRASLLRHNARVALRGGDRTAARKNFVEALRLEPFHLKAYKGLIKTFLP